MGQRMPPRNEKFTLFSTAGTNVVDSAAILMESAAAARERWAELANRMHDTEHAGDDTTKEAPPGHHPFLPVPGAPGRGGVRFRVRHMPSR